MKKNFLSSFNKKYIFFFHVIERWELLEYADGSGSFVTYYPYKNPMGIFRVTPISMKREHFLFKFPLYIKNNYIPACWQLEIMRRQFLRLQTGEKI